MRIWKGAKLFAVVSDGFDRAAFHCLLAKSLLFGRLRLLIDIAVAAIVISREIRGRCLAAKVAVDALLVDVEFPTRILGPFVSLVRHSWTRRTKRSIEVTVKRARRDEHGVAKLDGFKTPNARMHAVAIPSFVPVGIQCLLPRGSTKGNAR